MSPVTHLLIGWTVANSVGCLSRRERGLVTFAGVAPDLDGLGLIVELATANGSHPLLWWSQYHHVLAHNLGFALLLTAAVWAASTRRNLSALLALLTVHLHLLGDLAGARGPDGEQWPIPYLAPFSQAWQLAVPWQWTLNAWPNLVITVILLGILFRIAWQCERSPLEFIWPKADRVFAAALRRRFPPKNNARLSISGKL